MQHGNPPQELLLDVQGTGLQSDMSIVTAVGTWCAEAPDKQMLRPMQYCFCRAALCRCKQQPTSFPSSFLMRLKSSEPPNSFARFLSLTNTFSTSSMWITEGAMAFATLNTCRADTRAALKHAWQSLSSALVRAQAIPCRGAHLAHQAESTRTSEQSLHLSSPRR